MSPGDVPQGRNNPSSHSEQSAEFRIEFFSRLSAWLADRRDTATSGRLLDFGCADLLLGRALDEIWVVDGYDEWPAARDAARRTIAGLRRPGEVFDRLDELPVAAYDGVILNSLFQYVPDEDAARRLLSDVAPLLAPGASIGVVITDVVSDGASSIVDLADLLRYAVGREGVFGGLAATIRGVRSGKPAKRHRMPEQTLHRAAASSGLATRRLEHGLTVFSRRATFVLQPAGPDRSAPGSDDRSRPS